MSKKQFNEEQKKAIKAGDGPVMVMAGPGSGKTLVITYRVRWLIKQRKIHPAHILVITFTRAAAVEMKRRFLALNGTESTPVTFGTLHSVFFMILRHAYHYHAGQIIQEETRRQYVRKCIESLELEMEDEKEFITGIIGEISYLKGEMLSLEYFHSNYCSDEMFAKIFREYETRLRQDGLIDFDDILVFCCELLEKRPDILAMWQNRFRYILIDEFQDINKVQYRIVKMLAEKRRNLFVVGDDDQSIYRFRGARPEIMLGFEKDYPDVYKVVLGINYRCSAQIVEGARNLIEKNHKRFPKDLESYRGKKEPIQFETFDSGFDESIKIAEKIREFHKNGIALEDMAVIFRTRNQPRQLIARLMEQNISFTMQDVIPNMFQHWIARDLIAYMQLAGGDRSRKLVFQVMNRPKRYFSRQMFPDPQVDFGMLRQETFGRPWLYQYVDSFEKDLYQIKKKTPYEAIAYIRNTVGYENYIAEYATFRHIDSDPLKDILDQIHDSAKEYKTADEWFGFIEEYSQELQRQKDAGRRMKKDGVMLTTMHSAKGLEYEVVFVIDSNEGVTPHNKAVKESDLEEERRLYYVAMTRAKTRLFLYSVKKMYEKEMIPSRFLAEIRYDPDRFAKGTRIVHKTLGQGVVDGVKDGKIRLQFDRDKKKRTFDLSYLLERGLLEILL